MPRHRISIKKVALTGSKPPLEPSNALVVNGDYLIVNGGYLIVNKT